MCIFFALIGRPNCSAENIWQPNPNYYPYLWSNPNHWSEGVPTAGSDVSIGGFGGGPTLDVDAEVHSLTIQGRSSVSGNRDESTPRNLTVTGTTTIQSIDAYGGGSLRVTTGDIFSLGTLANYSGGVLTGAYSCGDLDGLAAPRRPTVLQFRGANVTDNRAAISLSGADAAMLDQETGGNAFRNLAINRRSFSLADAPSFSTIGDFTNEGTLYISDYQDAPPTIFTVNGSLIQKVVGTPGSGFTQILGNAQIIVKQNAGNSGVIYINNDAGAPPGDAILSVDGNLTNSGRIDISGASGRQARLVVGGDFVNKGNLSILGSGSVEVNGVFVIASGTFTLSGESGSGTSQVVASSIDLSAGTTFRAKGIISADLIDRGVLEIGSSPGLLTVNGNLSLVDTTLLKIEIGGLTPGAEFDRLEQVTPTGGTGIVLDGTLSLTLINGFEVNGDQTFDVVISDRPLRGAFDNIASGDRLMTRDGAGSFRVDYAGTDKVTLSDFQFAPPPVITAFSASAVPNSFITIYGTGFLGTNEVQFNGSPTYYFVVESAERITAYVPGDASSGAITIITSHGLATSASSFTVLGDADGDGLPDAFEQQYPTASEPYEDTDGDGMSNLDEYRAGTDPTAGSSALRITSVLRRGNDVTLTFPGVAGKAYRVEASANLEDGFTQDLLTLPPRSSTATQEVTLAGEANYPKRFYRLVVLP